MFPFVISCRILGARGRNRFDRRLFFREQAKRLTIGIVSGEASRPSTAQEADAVVAVAQDKNQVGRWLSHSAASRMPFGDSETAAGLAFEKVRDAEIFRDRNAWRGGPPIRLHFLRSGRPGLGPSNLFADATPITGCIDARGYNGIDRQRGAVVDAGGDLGAGNNMPRLVVQTGTF